MRKLFFIILTIILMVCSIGFFQIEENDITIAEPDNSSSYMQVVEQQIDFVSTKDSIEQQNPMLFIITETPTPEETILLTPTNTIYITEETPTLTSTVTSTMTLTFTPTPIPTETISPTNIPEKIREVEIFTSRGPVVELGEPIILTSELRGFENCSSIEYQWEVDRNDGLGFVAVEGGNEPTYVYSADMETLTWSWRLRVYYRIQK